MFNKKRFEKLEERAHLLELNFKELKKQRLQSENVIYKTGEILFPRYDHQYNEYFLPEITLKQKIDIQDKEIEKLKGIVAELVDYVYGETT